MLVFLCSLLNLHSVFANSPRLHAQLLTTRLMAVISPTPTVGQVNEALTSVNGRITISSRDLGFVDIDIPPASNEVEARVVSKKLMSLSAFLMVDPVLADSPRLGQGRPTSADFTESCKSHQKKLETFLKANHLTGDIKKDPLLPEAAVQSGIALLQESPKLTRQFFLDEDEFMKKPTEKGIDARNFVEGLARFNKIKSECGFILDRHVLLALALREIHLKTKFQSPRISVEALFKDYLRSRIDKPLFMAEYLIIYGILQDFEQLRIIFRSKQLQSQNRKITGTLKKNLKSLVPNSSDYTKMREENLINLSKAIKVQNKVEKEALNEVIPILKQLMN